MRMTGSAAIATTLKLSRRAASTEIRCQIHHPMETGRRIDRSNRPVAPHFIQKLYFEINGRQVAEVDAGAAVARNPVFIIRVPSVGPKDTVAVRWTDNLGKKGGASATVG